MLRIAICDDDIDFLNQFNQIIETTFSEAYPDQKVKITTFSSGALLVNQMEKERIFFDIIFLDVEMPELNGFQVAQRLKEVNPNFILIFTTYMEHQSREGYLYGAFRYVFKNQLERELKEALEGIMKKLNLLKDEKEISLKYRHLGLIESLTVKEKDIIFLKAEKTRRIILKTTCSEYDLLIKPLSTYAKLFDSAIFVPIMRNYLLNFNHVESIEGENFLLTGGLTVPLGVNREVRKNSMKKYLEFLERRI